MLLKNAPHPETGPLGPEQENAYPNIDVLTYSDIEELGQVMVHCLFKPDFFDCIRIWPTTYLICSATGRRCRLLHAEGIPYAPEWLPAAAGSSLSFLLVFEGLPRSCTLFDLVEEIADPGGFHVCGIRRNGRDVYRIQL